nr:putative ribonuclease H-like domain-containing protein [Tanacetum cinerariifolium]
LKGHPKLGLWYPKASSFDLVAYSDSDNGGASQDRKSTTGGSQFLGRREFEALMHENFQMSAMGELNFFLGLQVLQKKDGIFLSQDKYIGDILKKFGFSDVRSSNTLMDKENP